MALGRSVYTLDDQNVADVQQIPAVLYYQRVDAKSTLDYSSLVQQADYSILFADHSIAKNRDPARMQHIPLKPEELPSAGTLISIDAELSTSIDGARDPSALTSTSSC